MKRSAAITSALAVAALLAVAGCSETIEGSPRPAGSTGAATSQGPSQVDGAYTSVDDLLTAIADRQRQDETVRFELSGEGFPIEGSGESRIDESGTSSKVTIRADEFGSIEAVLLPGELYLKLPPGANFLGGDKPWVKLSGDSGGPFGALLGPVLEQLGSSTDPAAQLRGYGDAVTITGTRTDGDLTVYDLSLDTAEIAGDPAFPDGVPVPGATTMTLSVDDQDRLHEVVVNSDLQGTALTVSTTFSGWGESVDIEAPPADQVGEF